MEFKSFDRALFEENDRRAREAVKKHLGAGCIDNDDVYGPDLIFNGKFIEVEVVKKWSKKFPYPVTNIPGRKGKWKDLDIEYWRLSNDLSKAQIIQGNQLIEKYLSEVPNRYMSAGEFFYRIPVKEVIEITLGVNDEEHS